MEQIHKSEPRAKPARRAANGSDPRSVSDPREVAMLVMARMNLVSAKKDELTLAIKSLTDITQQLARAHGQHVQTIEALTRRLGALEAASAAAANGKAAKT